MQKILYLLISLLFLGAPLSSLGATQNLLSPIILEEAEAATSPTQCLLSDKFQELDRIRKSENPEDKLLEELSLRKEILHQVLDCALEDIEKLKKALIGIETEDQEIKELRDRLVDRFREASEHYKGEKERVKDLGLQASKDQARDILAWKKAYHEPLAEEVTNLLIWTKNEGIMRIAKERLQDITRTVSRLKLTEEEGIRTLFNKSEKNLKLALDQHQDAKDLIKRMITPEESLSLIKSSLDSLAETYRTFFELSEEVKKILPL